MVTTDDEDLAWQRAQLPRPRLRREGAAEPARAGAEAALHPQHGRLELPHDGDAVGHRPGGTGPDGHLEHAGAAAQRADHHGRAQGAAAGEVPAHRHAGAPERLVRDGLLARHREHGLRHPASSWQPPAPRARRAGRSSGRSATPSAPSRSTTPSAAPGSRSGRRNTPIRPASTTRRWRCRTRCWHEQHTFTCFAYPTYTEENCRQIASALTKVIKAFAKKDRPCLR